MSNPSHANDHDYVYVVDLIPRELADKPPEVVLGWMVYYLEQVAAQWRADDPRYAAEALTLVEHIRHFEKMGQYRTRGRPPGSRDMTAAEWRYRRQHCEDACVLEQMSSFASVARPAGGRKGRAVPLLRCVGIPHNRAVIAFLRARGRNGLRVRIIIHTNRQ